MVAVAESGESRKKVAVERNTRTKAEKEYIKGIIQNLSLQRLTDQEIVDYLHNEKQIEIGRSTVAITRNQIEKQAEKWYIELRNSAYKYLAQYKQRIDSLLSYQKTLHEIISNTNKDEVKIRAISELHSIEMDILSLWKQLPASNIVNTVDNTENEKKVQWAVEIGGGQVEEKEGQKEPIVGFDSEPWALSMKNNNKKESEVWTVDAPNPITEQEIQPQEQEEETIPIATQDPEPTQSIVEESDQEQKPKDIDVVDIDILGRWPKPFDVVPWVQCKFNSLGKDCNKWFKNKEIRSKHIAKYHS